MKHIQKTIGIAVAGGGARLRGLLKKLLAQCSEVRLVGLYDPLPQSVEAMHELFGDFVNYATYADLLADPEVDWVAIGSCNSQHAQQIISAREAGKHIFCEKPLATNMKDCQRIESALEGYDKQFSFGLVLRYSPFYREVKKLLGQGAVGKILSMEFNETLDFNHGGYIMGNWRRLREHAGPHILEKCCHDFDIANWFTQSLPVTAASFGDTRFFKPENAGLADEIGLNCDGKPAFATWSDPRRVNPFSGSGDVLDCQVAILQYANGVQASFHTNTVASIPERRFYIVGDRGTLRADAVAATIEYAPMRHHATRTTLRLAVYGGHAGGDSVLMDDLRSTMLHSTPPKAGIKEAIASAVPCFAVDQAQRTRQVVDIGPWWDEFRLNP